MYEWVRRRVRSKAKLKRIRCKKGVNWLSIKRWGMEAISNNDEDKVKRVWMFKRHLTCAISGGGGGGGVAPPSPHMTGQFCCKIRLFFWRNLPYFQTCGVFPVSLYPFSLPPPPLSLFPPLSLLLLHACTPQFLIAKCPCPSSTDYYTLTKFIIKCIPWIVVVGYLYHP